MQTTSTAIRQARFAGQAKLGGKARLGAGVSQQVREASKRVFAAQQELVSRLQEQILIEGQPETWSQTATATHFRIRRGGVAGENTDAQVHTHELGIVIRFWVYGANFDVRTRDLILLRLRTEEKGFEVWLDDGEKVFPHEGGKYALAGQQILANMLSGR